jgi:hypothetical protein
MVLYRRNQGSVIFSSRIGAIRKRFPETVRSNLFPTHLFAGLISFRDCYTAAEVGRYFTEGHMKCTKSALVFFVMHTANACGNCLQDPDLSLQPMYFPRI